MSDFLTWLAGLDRDRLTDLLQRRPDVLRGSSPPDLAAVEARMRQDRSVAHALLRQPRPALDVLSALIVLGGSATATALADTLEASGAGHAEAVAGWLAELEDDGLVWLDDGGTAHTAPRVDGVLPVPVDWGLPARQLLDPIPKAALDPVLRAWGLPRATTKHEALAALVGAFGDPVRLAAQIERLTPRQREILGSGAPGWRASLADQRAYTERLQADRAGVEAGLLVAPYASSPLDAEAPAEVLRALRGRGLPFAPSVPSLVASTVDPAHLERESTAAVLQLDAAALAVVDHVRERPVKLLQRGGVGTQEVSRLAKGSAVDPALVRLVLHAACAARLFEDDGRHLKWGDTTDAWRDLDAGPRTALLLERWLRTPGAPTQTHDAAGRPVAVAAPERRCHACADGRLAVLEEWARLDGAPDEADLASRVAWLRPFAHLAHRELVPVSDPWDDGWPGRRSPRSGEPVPLAPAPATPDLGTIGDEARLLGLVARGAATPLLRDLLADDHAGLVARLDVMLPAATRTATFGSDLTAMVVGPPTGGLSALLDSCATRESRGGAVVWRFSPASVRRALDAGETVDGLRARLTDVAGAGLPQPLGYLLSDVGRRHGSLRVAPARAVIRCDDEALLSEVVVDRKLRALALRRVAPTVAVSQVGDRETLRALRGAGYLPMPEAPEPPPGTPPAPAAAPDPVIDLRRRSVPSGRRSPAQSSGDHAVVVPTPAAPAVSQMAETPGTAAARLVGLAHAPGGPDVDPRLVTAIRRANRILSQHEIDTLAASVSDGGAVRIRYRSSSGAVTDRVVSDLVISGPHVLGWCHLRDDERDFLLAGIVSVGHP